MRGKQKTIDSFLEEVRTESEDTPEAQSITMAEMKEMSTCDDLIDRILSDDNLSEALERVVGNRGAPGMDGMSVLELPDWLHANAESLKERIRQGKYKPKPVRRVEIPKPDGGIRELGVPTVVDRLIQQAVAQVLTPIYEQKFSDNSFGFRPGRNAHDAISRAKEFYDEGYTFVVDLDLSKFFDTLNQDILLNLLRKDIHDWAVIRLIKGFLRSGVVLPNGLLVSSDMGSPQGGPLSPLLANIYLDSFDKLLESRGLHFVRYADDVNIYVRTPRAAERVMQSCINYLEGKSMRLKVNRDKSAVGYPAKLKFLGFTVLNNRGKAIASIHKKSIIRFKKRVREITKRNRGHSVKSIVSELKSYVRGWAGYYGIGLSRTRAKELDEWMRRRVRQYIFKQWKRYPTRLKNLLALCPRMFRDDKGRPGPYWRINCSKAASRTPWSAMKYDVVYKGMGLEYLRELGMYFLMDDANALRQGV